MPSGNIYDATSGQLISYGGAPGQFVGATASAAGSAGVVPAPSAGDNNKVLRGDGTWGDSAGPVIAGVENTTTSTSVYASGDYVLVMGALYEVTSAIAIGDTLAPGINLSQNPTKVMTEITKLNQNLTNISEQIGIRYIESSNEVQLFKNGTWETWLNPTGGGSGIQLITTPTSNVANEGIITSTDNWINAYQAFTDAGSSYITQRNATNSITFTFTNPTYANRIVAEVNNASVSHTVAWYIDISSDGSTFSSIASISFTGNGSFRTLAKDFSAVSIKAFRIRWVASNGDNVYCPIRKVMAYNH